MAIANRARQSRVFWAFLSILPAGEAFAVDAGVRAACKSDYLRHCSAHAPDSPGVKSCMRSVGTGLSQGCLVALARGGYINAAEIAKHTGGGKSEPVTAAAAGKSAKVAPVVGKVKSDKAKATKAAETKTKKEKSKAIAAKPPGPGSATKTSRLAKDQRKAQPVAGTVAGKRIAATGRGGAAAAMSSGRKAPKPALVARGAGTLGGLKSKKAGARIQAANGGPARPVKPSTAATATAAKSWSGKSAGATSWSSGSRVPSGPRSAAR